MESAKLSRIIAAVPPTVCKLYYGITGGLHCTYELGLHVEIIRWLQWAAHWCMLLLLLAI